jgi:hypothetical protein
MASFCFCAWQRQPPLLSLGEGAAIGSETTVDSLVGGGGKTDELSEHWLIL